MNEVQEGILKNHGRVFAKIHFIPDGCWEWIGARTSVGYGNVWWEGRNRVAHHVVWELLIGPIPDPPLQADHLCRNRCCVRPDHIEWVTARENTNRGTFGTGKERWTRTDCCVRGHLRTDANSYWYRQPRGTLVRRCKDCHAERTRAKRDERYSQGTRS